MERDVKNKENGESWLDDAEAHYKTALNALAEPVIVIWRDQPLYANQAMLDLLGYGNSLDDFLNVSVEAWVHTDDLPVLREAIGTLSADQELDHSVQFRVVTLEGTSKHIETRPRPIVWRGQEAWINILIERHPSLVEASDGHRSDSLFRNVFRISPELMAITNPVTGKFIDINPAFLNAFGMRRSEVIGRTSRELGIWADPTFLNRFVEELKLSASMMDVPTTVRMRGGVIRHFRIYAQKLDHEGEEIMLVMGRDVTDDLAQAQELQRSRDNAELANRAKSEFLANMSHELRTPLNAILGFAEIIRDELMGDTEGTRYREYAGDIHASGNHLLTIINDILDLSKVEAGRLDAQLRWSDPVPALEMCVSLVEHRAKEAGLRLEYKFTEQYMWEADERLIKQVCLNLLSNAIKFTQEGGKVCISLEEDAENGLCLAVQDTGIGMTPEEIRIAKRPFGQVDNILSRRHQGSGLGLPLVAAFVERLGADMHITSTPGRGTRVAIHFPEHKIRSAQFGDDGGTL